VRQKLEISGHHIGRAHATFAAGGKDVGLQVTPKPATTRC